MKFEKIKGESELDYIRRLINKGDRKIRNNINKNYQTDNLEIFKMMCKIADDRIKEKWEMRAFRNKLYKEIPIIQENIKINKI